MVPNKLTWIEEQEMLIAITDTFKTGRPLYGMEYKPTSNDIEYTNCKYVQGGSNNLIEVYEHGETITRLMKTEEESFFQNYLDNFVIPDFVIAEDSKGYSSSFLASTGVLVSTDMSSKLSTDQTTAIADFRELQFSILQDPLNITNPTVMPADVVSALELFNLNFLIY